MEHHQEQQEQQEEQEQEVVRGEGEDEARLAGNV